MSEDNYRFLKQMDMGQLRTIYDNMLSEARAGTPNAGESLYPDVEVRSATQLYHAIKNLDAKSDILGELLCEEVLTI